MGTVRRLVIRIKGSLDLVVLIVGLLVTFWAWRTASDLVGKQVLAEQVKMVDQTEEYLKFTIAGYEALLSGARGLFAASQEVGREEFNDYFKGVNLSDQDSGVYSVSYVSRVLEAQVGDFFATLRHDLPEASVAGVLQPKLAATPEHYLVNYLAFANETSYTAYGLDLQLTDVRRRALETARDTGEYTASGPLVIVGPEKPGFILVAPIYRNGADVSTISARREALVGWVNVVVLYEKLFGKVFAPSEHVDIHLIDGDEELYDVDHGEDYSDHKFLASKNIRVGGREWKMEFLKIGELGGGVEDSIPVVMLTVGLIISVLLFGLAYAVSSSQIRAEDMAQKMTSELQTMKVAVDSAFNHVIITDSDGKIIYANKAVERITGYSRGEIIGNNPRLWGGVMNREFYKTMWQTIKFDKQPFSGEMQNRRKDGTVYDVLVSISPIINEAGSLVGFVGVEADISQQKLIQNQLVGQRDELERVNKLMVGRELKMIELKDEIIRLKGEK